MNRLFHFAALFCSALLAADTALACGPFFPISYTDPNVANGTFGRGRNSVGDEPGYSVGIDVRYELGLLGRHFFAEWADRKLRQVPCRSLEAHRADMLEASAAAGLRPDKAEARVAALISFASHAEQVLRDGGAIGLPTDLRDFEREFFLYALGRAQRLADPTLDEPPAWLELLSMPPARRRFRTVWARHGLVLAAPDLKAADRRLRELRADIDAGFHDTCGLEEAVVMQLLRRGGTTVEQLHWLPLAAAVSGSPRIVSAFNSDAAYMSRSSLWNGDIRNKVRDIVVSDSLAAEVAVTLCSESVLPEDFRDAAPVLCADRRAWAAFRNGDFERGRKLLALAPTNSLVRLFWEARLARIDGDFAESAELLRRWLAEATRRGVPEDVFNVCYRDISMGTPNNTLDVYGAYLRNASQARMEQVVRGELGSVLLTEGDFVEALHAFIRADSWIDAAFVAERCLTADALMRFVREVPVGGGWNGIGGENFSEKLRWLLARRLLREGRIAEAGEFFPSARLKEWKLYATLMASAAWDKKQLSAPSVTDDVRALATLNLARLLYARGMELMGTELEPDVSVWEGDVPVSGIRARTLADLPHIKPLPEGLPKLPKSRFHYRLTAMDAARRAAVLAADPDIRAASFLLQGQINVITKDSLPADVEPAYRALCAISDHPLARAAREARWFPWNAAKPFLGPLNRARRDSSMKLSALSLDKLRALLRPEPSASPKQMPGDI
jgi:tetratricopeptide (TPR) repeat protein